METNVLKGMTGITSKFAQSVVRLTSGLRGKSACDINEAAGVNLSASGSCIIDADAAREMIEFTKSKILSRASSSVSGQANQSQRKIIGLMQ
jgi:flagellin-like hook-associated protein FlgL